jgi:hypothetical protein
LTIWLLIALFFVGTLPGCSLPIPIQRQRALDQHIKATDELADLFDAELPILPNTLAALAVTTNALRPIKSLTSPEAVAHKLDNASQNWKDASRDMRMFARLIAGMFSQDDDLLRQQLRAAEAIFRQYPDDPDYQSWSMTEEQIATVTTKELDTPKKRQEMAKLLRTNSAEVVTNITTLKTIMTPLIEDLTSRLRKEILVISSQPEEPLQVRLAVADKLVISQELPPKLELFFTKAEDVTKTYKEVSDSLAASLIANRYTMEDVNAMAEKAEKVVQQIERLKSLVTRIAALVLLL